MKYIALAILIGLIAWVHEDDYQDEVRMEQLRSRQVAQL